jgi:hypothetical protein
MIKIIIIKKETFNKKFFLDFMNAIIWFVNLPRKIIEVYIISSDMSDKQILENSLNDKEKILFGKTLYYQYSLLKQRLMRILITFLNWLFLSSKDIKTIQDVNITGI